MAPLTPALLLVLPLAGATFVLGLSSYPRGRLLSTVVASAASLILSVHLAVTWNSEITHMVGGWHAPYGIMLRVDALALVMLLLNGMIFLAATLYQAGRETSGRQTQGRMLYHLTFPLLLFSLNGLFLTADFFNFYVFFELTAVTSYLLVAMGTHHPIEAAWKYATQSILGSSLLLAGIAFIYGTTGSVSMDDVAARLAFPVTWLAPLILVALLLKGSLFPFHFWQPDAHAAATTPGSAILAGILINIGVYGLLRFWPILFSSELRAVLLWLGAASVFFGGIAAWRETDVKRMLGFSSTSQLGFVLIAMGWEGQAATAAAVFFVAHHGLSKALLFLAAGAVADARGVTKFPALLGRGATNPWLRAAFLLGCLSLVGLPPGAGFIGKVALLRAGFTLSSWPWVAALLTGTVITLVYATRTFQTLFWHTEERRETEKAVKVPLLAGVALSFLALLVLAAGLLGDPWWALANEAAAGLQGTGFANRGGS